ncbi:unnamed protein product [Lathyrus sativus]|nr:unnamed protein product [Lathyrus sativus]
MFWSKRRHPHNAISSR